MTFRGPRLPAEPLNLMLMDGATRQIDAAIDAFGDGRFDIALTLAGAAEGMIQRDGPHMFAWLRDNPRAAERFPTKKEWINLLNRELYWLKHGGADTMEIDCATAAFVIARAASKLDVWTDRMKEFGAWLYENVDHI